MNEKTLERIALALETLAARGKFVPPPKKRSS